MTKQEYHALLTFITDKKSKNEAEDAALEKKINDCLHQLKNGANQSVQTEMDRCKHRRFPELDEERRALCEGYIREKTGFTGNVIQIYQQAAEADLKGEQWARFMLDQCGCPEPT